MNLVRSDRFPGRGAPGVLIVQVAALLSMLIAGVVQGQTPLNLADEIVSRNSVGQRGSGGSFKSAISGDGRYVVFASGAANLVSGDTNGRLDIFVFDRVAVTIRRVSTTAAETQVTDGSSEQPTITADGRFVAFSSRSATLVGGDTNGPQPDVFVKDLSTGSISLVSLSTNNAQLSLGCDAPDIADNGQRIAMRCLLGPNFSQISVRDRGAGQTILVPNSAGSEFGIAPPNISGNGGHVTFLHSASNGVWHYDLTAQTNSVVSVGVGGANANNVSAMPAPLSFDGCRIAFASSASNLDPVRSDFNNRQDIFVRDRCGGFTERVNLEVSDGQLFEAQLGDSAWPSISADGRYIAFHTRAQNLQSDTNQISGNTIVVRDRKPPLGATLQINTYVVGGQTFDFFAVQPAISDDGRQLAAQASGNTVGDQILAVGNSTVFAQPVVLVNNPNGGEMFAPVPSGDANLVLVSSNAAGFDLGWGGNDSDGNEDAFVFRPAIGGNGACMEQASMSSGDFNSPCFNPAFKHEKGPTPNTPNIPCPNPNATEICAPSIEPTMAASRMLVAFVTADSAVALTKNETKIERDARRKGNSFGIYLRDLVSGAVFRVSTALPGGVGTVPQLSADGNSIVFVSNEDRSINDINTGADAYQVRIKPNLADGFDPPVCLSCKDTVGSGNNPPGAGNPVVSADGNVVAMNVPTTGGGTQILLRNLVNGSSQRMGTPTGNSQRPRMDYSGSRLVFGSDANLDGTDANAKPDVYLYENCCNKLTRMSKPITGDASDASTDAIISGDGRTVSYVSLANNLDPNDPASNGKQHVFVQRLDGARVRMRLARNSQGQLSDDDSFRPALGYNGNALFFDSLAGNLKDGEDFNPGRDVFRRVNPVSADIVFGAGFE